MLIITKITAHSRYSGAFSPMSLMCSYDNEVDSDLSVVLYDTVSTRKSIISCATFGELIDNLLKLNVYGIGQYKTETTDGYSLCCMSKLSFTFLDYVESVDIVKRESCGVDLSVLDSINQYDLTLDRHLDEYNTFFQASFCPDPSEPGDFCIIPISIFDAVCLIPNCYIDGNFYLPFDPTPDERCLHDGCDESSHIVRVTCSDSVKAQSLVGRSQVMRPNFVHDLYSE